MNYLCIVQFLVTDIGRDNLPYYHQHLWATEDLNHALVEILEYQKDCERIHHVKMHLFKLWLEERQDIGV